MKLQVFVGNFMLFRIQIFLHAADRLNVFYRFGLINSKTFHELAILLRS